MKKISIIIFLSVAVALTGCSSWKKLIGKNDDTILPGQREDIISQEHQTAKDPAVLGQQATQQ
jgi:starvation-inducible outer membrane lipoprotein